MKFEVVRDEDRHLDIENICKALYPELRQCVDRKWLFHECRRCSTRLVVMDGDAKAYRFEHLDFELLKKMLLAGLCATLTSLKMFKKVNLMNS